MMEINYENLKRLVDQLPLPIEPTIIYENFDTVIFDKHEFFIQVNERTYYLRPIIYPERKAFGLLYQDGKPGSICFHYDALPHEQKSWIVHELAELELSALGKSRAEAHAIA